MNTHPESSDKEENFSILLANLYVEKWLIISIASAIILTSIFYANSLPIRYKITTHITDSYENNDFIKFRDVEHKTSNFGVTEFSPTIKNTEFVAFLPEALYRLRSKKYHSDIFDKLNFSNQLNLGATKESFLSKISFKIVRNKDTRSEEDMTLEVPYGLFADKVSKNDIDIYIEFMELLMTEVKLAASQNIIRNLSTEVKINYEKLMQERILLKEFFASKVLILKNKNFVSQEIKLFNINKEIEFLETQKTNSKENAIMKLQAQEDIAIAMGVKDFTLTGTSLNSIDSENYPSWLLFGEKAISEELKSLRKYNYLDSKDLLELKLVREKILQDDKRLDNTVVGLKLKNDREVSQISMKVDNLQKDLLFLENLTLDSFRIELPPKATILASRSNLIIFIGILSGFFISLLIAIIRSQFRTHKNI